MIPKQRATNVDRTLFGLLLLPSWLSAIVAFLCGVGVSLGTVVLSHFQSSSFRIQILQGRIDHPATYQNATNSILSNRLISNLPLLLFWMLIGLVVYTFAANFFTAIRNTAELRSELGFVNANRHELLVKAARHFAIRLAVLAVWIVYIVFFFNHVIQYCIQAALAGSGQVGDWQSGLYLLLSMAIMILAIHIHTIFLRCLLFRPRVFSNALYIF